jgi:hypothetical protein
METDEGQFQAASRRMESGRERLGMRVGSTDRIPLGNVALWLVIPVPN